MGAIGRGANLKRKPQPKCIEYNSAHESHGYNGVRWIENVSRGLRLVGFADEIAKSEGRSRTIDHKGWFTDEDDTGETYRGVVYLLPSRGEPRYVYGYADPCNEDCALLCFDTEADKMDAARYADQFAERFAEEQRDCNRAYRAGRRAEDLADDIKQARKDALAIGAEMRAARALVQAPTICTILRGKIRSLYLDIQKARKERATLISDYGQQPGFVE